MPAVRNLPLENCRCPNFAVPNRNLDIDPLLLLVSSFQPEDCISLRVLYSQKKERIQRKKAPFSLNYTVVCC